MKKSNVTFEVLVRGRPVREFHHTDGNVYIEGRKGSPFEIRIRNDNYSRVLVVPSVDGLSVMDGKVADSGSNGYIVNGFSSLTIPGWRLNNDDVAEFFFQDLKGGYAEQTGQGGNQGVLGLMVFNEKPAYNYTYNIKVESDKWERPYDKHYWTWGPFYTTGGVTYTAHSNDLIGSPRGSSAGGTMTSNVVNCSYTANAAQSEDFAKSTQDSADADEPLSVGFGEKQEHKVTSVFFDRGSVLDTLVMYYDTRKGLEKRGIQVTQPEVRPTPNPFPGITGCQPPSGWKG